MRVRHVASASVAILAAMSCGTSHLDRGDLWDAVPSGSVAVARLAWQEIAQDPPLRRTAGLAELEGLSATLGIAPETIDEVLVFSNGAEAAKECSGVFIAAEDAGSVLDEAMRREGWTSQALLGLAAYCDPARTRWAASLASDVVVVGTRSGLEAVAEVLDGARPPFRSTDDAAALVESVDAEGTPIRAVFLVRGPAALIGRAALAAAGLGLNWAIPGGFGDSLAKAGAIDGFGAAVGRDADRIGFRLHVLFSTESAARTVATVLDASRLAAASLAERDPSVDRDRLNVFSSLEVGHTDRRLRIAMFVGESQLPSR